MSRGREVLVLWGMGLGLGLGIPGTSFDCARGGPLGRSCLIDSASWGAVFDDDDDDNYWNLYKCEESPTKHMIHDSHSRRIK